MAALALSAAFGLLLFAVSSPLVQGRRYQSATFPIGGASSFEKLADKFFKDPALCAPIAKGYVYASVGSGAGIDNFNNGLYATALSDGPMTPTQERAGISLKPGKLTIPLVLARYSFFVSGAPDTGAGVVKLDDLSTYNMFRFGKGPYVPVSRQDSSGTTFVIKRYWNKGPGSGKLFQKDMATDKTLFSTAPFPSSWRASALRAKQTDGVCALTAAVKGRITYSQVGVCNLAVPVTALGEVLLKNKAGNFIKASTADPKQSIQRALPGYGDSWSTMADSMIFQNGGATLPIASFIYGFIPKTLVGRGPNAKLGKSLFLCINNNMGRVAASFQFDALDQKIVTANAKAINGVPA